MHFATFFECMCSARTSTAIFLVGLHSCFLVSDSTPLYLWTLPATAVHRNGESSWRGDWDVATNEFGSPHLRTEKRIGLLREAIYKCWNKNATQLDFPSDSRRLSSILPRRHAWKSSHFVWMRVPCSERTSLCCLCSDSLPKWQHDGCGADGSLLGFVCASRETKQKIEFLVKMNVRKNTTLIQFLFKKIMGPWQQTVIVRSNRLV